MAALRSFSTGNALPTHSQAEHAFGAGVQSRLLCTLLNLQGWVLSVGVEVPLVFGLLVLGLFAHGINMFNYPGYAHFGDEGIYSSQAWAVLREGRLANYTYFYDHAPGSWLLLAGWVWITGGFHAFGNPIDSGRALMLLLHVLSLPLVYHLVRKLGGGVAAAALGAILLAVSPLATFYLRLVLLEGFMVFWVLLSLDLLLNGRGRLSRVVLSGLCFGIALLSKETAAVFLPGMLYVTWQDRWRHQGRFAIVGWVVPMAMVVSLYPLYAAMKNELLPAGVVLDFFVFQIGAGTDHVSLLDSLRWQLARGGGGMAMLDMQREFWKLLHWEWLPKDAFLLVGGLAATVVNLVRGIRNRRALAAGLLGIMPALYLFKSGTVFDFYIGAVIPFFCLNIALLAGALLRPIPAAARAGAAAVCVAGLGLGYLHTGITHTLYTGRAGDVVRESDAWIKQNLPPSSYLIIHDDAWPDLHEPRAGEPVFPNAHTHWKVASDPEIRTGVFHDDWRTVDYLVMVPDMPAYFDQMGNDIAKAALAHAHLVRRWQFDGRDAVEIYKVDKTGATEDGLLAGSYTFTAARFQRDGAFVAADGTVTGSSQAAALLRAVWTNDRSGFDRIWDWTSQHLLLPNGLPASLWSGGAVIDARTTADTDADTALALLLAGKRWGRPDLLAAGVHMVDAVWASDVTVVAGSPHVVGGDWAAGDSVVGFASGTFAPYAYRIFQDVDPEHDWQAVIDSGYATLIQESQAALGGSRAAGLPADWIGLDRSSGNPVPLGTGDRDVTRYGDLAARAFWRVALDARWSNDDRALTILRQATVLRDAVKERGTVAGTYTHDGTPVNLAPSLASTAGALAALSVLDPPSAAALYDGMLVGGASRLGGQAVWGSEDDLTTQEWGWFATAFYSQRLPDLWRDAA